MSTSRLILIGGGHSHIQFLKSWAMAKSPKVHEIMLVSDTVQTPYSGMLPGWMAGFYQSNELYFDLWKICERAGVVFIPEACSRLDLKNKRMELSSGREIEFDFLSINVGVTPEVNQIALEGLGFQRSLFLKPISRLQKSLEKVLNEPSSKLEDLKVGIVGGGASGFETSIALDLGFQSRGRKAKIKIYQSGDFLAGHSTAVKKRAQKILSHKGIDLVLDQRVRGFDGAELKFNSGPNEKTDLLVIATQARPPQFFKDSGLSLDSLGFVRVDESLRSISHPFVFAAGDCISFASKALPKSGVYAVRQGPILRDNLFRQLQGKDRFKKFHPQKRTLALMTSGHKRALLSYGPLALESAWLWTFKDKIDRAFMRRFGAEAILSTGSMAMGETPQTETNQCGGCGSKVSWDVLKGGLRNLEAEALQDAGHLDFRSRKIFGSIDGFRSFTKDHFLFGKIACLHAISDVFAQGVSPEAALVSLTLPVLPARRQSQLLKEVTAGIQNVFDLHKIRLLKGHTSEGAELSVHIAILGSSDKSETIKQGAREGDVLILTKALGLGGILHGQMKGEIDGDSLFEAYRELDLLPPQILEVLNGPSVSAATDLTGFGLIGHSLEMLKGTGLGLELDQNSIPVLKGFEQLFQRGVRSYLNAKNYSSFKDQLPKDFIYEEHGAIFDPQTNGGFLIASSNPSLVETLREMGYANASVIGRFSAWSDGPRVSFR